jgi:hypothetical protein
MSTPLKLAIDNAEVSASASAPVPARRMRCWARRARRPDLDVRDLAPGIPLFLAFQPPANETLPPARITINSRLRFHKRSEH